MVASHSVAAFVEIPGSFLESIATDSDRIPTLYYSGNAITRKIFWQRLRRIHRLIQKMVQRRETCLDFGGGGGVFLPSLAPLFRSVTSIDLETSEASQVVDRFRLENVRLVQADVRSGVLEQAVFDAIVAADVLEHFEDLGPPAAALHRGLGERGVLFTSLPSENFIYVGLRRVFGVEKPPDHYHSAREVEHFLETHGFRRLHRGYLPLPIPLAPLYLVSAWCRDPRQG
jgi:predicted TPR repeat methyltransferase